MSSWAPVKASKKANRTNNKIRAVVDKVLSGCKDKSKMLNLGLGDPTAYGMATCPAELQLAVTEALVSGKHDGYGGSAGTPSARAAIGATASPRAAAENVFVASGASGALELALGVLLDEGDNLLVPAPGFPLYETIAEAAGASVRSYPLDPDGDWEPDVAALAALVDGRTRAILVNTPSNPCGAFHSRASIEAIVRVAVEKKIPIVSDEIYSHLVFEEYASEFASVAEIAAGRAPVLVVDGLAKRFAVPGWRVGWVVLHDGVGALDAVRGGLEKLTTLILGASTLHQAAIAPALTPATPEAAAGLEAHRRAYAAALEANAKTIVAALNGAPGLACCTPKGAMYVMVRLVAPLSEDFRDGEAFSAALLAEELVFCLPGACFAAPDHIRLVTCGTPETTAAACAKIRAFAARKCA